MPYPLNDSQLTAEADATHRFIIGLYDHNNFEFAPLAAWLRANTTL